MLNQHCPRYHDDESQVTERRFASKKCGKSGLTRISHTFSMTAEQITQIVRQTLFISLEIAAPFLLLALIIGTVISLIQSVTQTQEMTLSFIPKMIVVAAGLGFLFPWMLKMLTKFTNNLLICQWEKVTSFMHYTQ